MKKRNEVTSPGIARLASALWKKGGNIDASIRVLHQFRDQIDFMIRTLEQSKKVCGSAMTQRPNKKKLVKNRKI